MCLLSDVGVVLCFYLSCSPEECILALWCCFCFTFALAGLEEARYYLWVSNRYAYCCWLLLMLAMLAGCSCLELVAFLYKAMLHIVK